MIDTGREDEGGKRKEGEEMKASGPTASPVLAPQKIGSRTATEIRHYKYILTVECSPNRGCGTADEC
jgi:hypothetical protein